MDLITLQPNAVRKIKEIMSDEPSTSRLRVFVEGGGCSGFSYGFTIDDQKNEDDFEVVVEDVAVLVDSMSSQYLQGAEIDYIESLAGSNFSIKNPNAQTSCGCGSSFSV